MTSYRIAYEMIFLLTMIIPVIISIFLFLKIEKKNIKMILILATLFIGLITFIIIYIAGTSEVYGISNVDQFVFTMIIITEIVLLPIILVIIYNYL